MDNLLANNYSTPKYTQENSLAWKQIIISQSVGVLAASFSRGRSFAFSFHFISKPLLKTYIELHLFVISAYQRKRESPLLFRSKPNSFFNMSKVRRQLRVIKILLFWNAH